MNPTPPPRVLAITTLIPNASLPNFGIFVLQRIKALSRLTSVKVAALTPYFPFASALERYAYRRNIPPEDTIEGVTIRYPRYISIPKFLKGLDVPFGVVALLPTLFRLRGKIDVLECQLAFPDGVCGAALGKAFGIPVSITIRGHDLNVLLDFPVRRRMIIWALTKARWVFTVADALRDSTLDLGIDPRKVHTVANGVDRQRFCQQDRDECRRFILKILKKTSLSKFVVVSVGHLIERKGHHILIEAIQRLRMDHDIPVDLLIVGASSVEGNYEKPLHELVEKLGVQEHVHFLGEIANQDLGRVYNAANLMCLASSKEGRPNVAIESLACGTPIVATNIWGTPEIVADPNVGILVERDVSSFVTAIEKALESSWNREYISSYAKRFSWEESAKKLLGFYSEAL